MPIRVLHVIGSLRLGGTQVCLKNIVEHASKDQVEHFIYPLRSRQIDISIDSNIITFPYPNYDLRKFFAILRICRQNKIDIIHAHLDKPIIGSLLATFFCDVKIVVHEHGPIFRKSWKQSFYRLALRLLQKRASRFIAVSKVTSYTLQKKAKIEPDKISVIYNSVDTDVFRPDEQNCIAVRNELGVESDDIIIGYAGRLNDIKGVDILIKAMPLLLRKNPKYLLVLAGDGPGRESYMNLAEKLQVMHRVKFLGFHDNVSRLMNAFDIGAVPSRQESLGISALELMSMKIPIVCSGVEGLSELVFDGKNGLVTPENTPGQLADCVDRLISNQRLRDEMVETAFNFVQDFDVINQVKAIEELYLDIVAGS